MSVILERVRTYEQYLPSGSGIPSPESCKTLNVSDIPLGYLYFRLAASALTTDATESQLLPTPTATLADHGGPNQRDSSGRPGLQMAAALWKTPVASDAANRQMYVNGRGEPNLSGQVRIAPIGPPPQCQKVIWPTPTTRDYKSADVNPNSKRFQRDTELNTAVVMMPTQVAGDAQGSHGGNMGSSLRTFTHMFPTPAAQDAKNSTLPPSQADRDTLPGQMIRDGQQGQLNPDWVEWLMGFPPGWTDIDADAEITQRDPHWWDAEPPIPRVAAGVAHRVGRLKCLGNAVVPAQFYPIFAAIAEIENNKL